LTEYAALGIYIGLAVALAAAVLVISITFGPRRPTLEKSTPYECGIVPTDPAHKRLSVRFYLTAMLFIIFDVEAVFFFPWAVLLRDQLRVFGLVEMSVFIAVLAVALAYIWGKGALEWE